MAVGWPAAANRQNDVVSLNLFTAFHLNLAYSSIEEEQRAEVVRRCYWPLLRLARDLGLPLGIEAPAYTLEAAAVADSEWLAEMRSLVTDGPCEFIGSGYAQLIGPLVPAEVNAANLRLGNDAYNRLLGFRPDIALVNEQAYSAGLVAHYLEAGHQAIVMEWDKPRLYSPGVAGRVALSAAGRVWTARRGDPAAVEQVTRFQKFQRYAHGEIELDEYLDYLGSHTSSTARAFPLYGGDIEVSTSGRPLSHRGGAKGGRRVGADRAAVRDAGLRRPVRVRAALFSAGHARVAGRGEPPPARVTRAADTRQEAG